MSAGQGCEAAGCGHLSRPRRSVWWETTRLRVLVADEDAAARAGIQGLMDGRAEVTVCGDGAEALWEAGRKNPSVVVLSATLPVVPAAEVAGVLSRHRDGPVSIAVGVGFGEADEAGAVLRAGANRVMSRPYESREVEPLIREHLGDRQRRPGVLAIGALELDGPAFEVWAAGRLLPLKLREFELLALLMASAGNVVTREEMREQLWESRGESVSANTIAVHIRRLRSHVEGVADILSVRSVGYRLRVQDRDGRSLGRNSQERATRGRVDSRVVERDATTPAWWLGTRAESS